MSDNLVHITIDGHSLSVPRGTLLVEAARELGIEIPVYCYHPKMKPVGACRVCAVEVEGQRRPIMTACTTEVMPNMVVHTRSENAIAAREGILEFLLINHPLDCPVCDRGGECDLQDFTLRYGPATTRFVEAKRHFAKSKQVGQNVILDRERCIMCQRCVRFCGEIAMEEGLVIVDRGNRSEIGTFEGRSFDSQYSGNTIELCPVGALTAKTYRFNARPWEQQHYAGVCNSCSVGCNLTVDVRFHEVVRLRSRCNDEIDDGWLCDRGRYSYQEIHAEDRLTSPMLRNSSGVLEAVTWDRALAAAAEKLRTDGGKAAVLLGSQLSVEDGHAFLRLARGQLKTGQIAHQHAEEALDLDGGAQASGRIAGLDSAEVIVCLGTHPHATHPIVDLRIKKGLRRGARLISLHSEPVMEGLADYRAVGRPAELWARLLQAIDALPEATPAGLKRPAPRPWEAGGATSSDWEALVACFRDKTRVMVVAGGDLAGQGLDDLLKTVQARGWASQPHGLLHLRSGSNALGLDQVGCQPDLGPGGGSLSEARAYSQSWGDFCTTSGKSYNQLASEGGSLMLAVGCDPLAEPGARKAGTLIACANSPNATTEKADIVFPLSSWAESHGVFVNTDGTIQLSRQAVLPVGESQPAWAIASALIKAVSGGDAPYKSTRQVFAEVGQLNPAFLGRSYRDFESKAEMHWSYPQQDKLGMPRPDLSAIPVPQPDTPMWMPVADTGSRVEKAGRLSRGDRPPSVPGQDDPRRIAALLGLAHDHVRHPKEETVAGAAAIPRAGYVPLRVVPTSSAQPAGPTPAKRHQKLGVAPHVPVAFPALPPGPEASDEEEGEENVSLSSLEVVTPSKAATPDTRESTEREKSEQGQGDSNVAVVDQVTKDDAAAENTEASVAEAADAAQASDTGLVAAKEGDAPDPQSAVSSEVTGDSVEEPQPTAQQEPPAPADEPASSPAKAKKGKRKSAKEKK
jgi:NADH-quinone oxidoreductase subunit G